MALLHRLQNYNSCIDYETIIVVQNMRLYEQPFARFLPHTSTPQSAAAFPASAPASLPVNSLFCLWSTCGDEPIDRVFGQIKKHTSLPFNPPESTAASPRGRSHFSPGELPCLPYLYRACNHHRCDEYETAYAALSWFFRLTSLLPANLELSDTQVHEPQLGALLGTAPHFCEVAVPKSRTGSLATRQPSRAQPHRAQPLRQEPPPTCLLVNPLHTTGVPRS